MLYGEEVFRSIEVTDDVQTSKLSFLDQIRLIISSMSNNDVAELDAAGKVSNEQLKKISALSSFIDKAIDRMNELGEDSATMKVSSEFLPYIDDIVSKDGGYGRYYDFKVMKRNIPMGVKHYFIVKISKKHEGGGEQSAEKD